MSRVCSISFHLLSSLGRSAFWCLTQLGCCVAWGNNHFVCGGAVQGGRVLGTYPDSLLAGSKLDVGRGRIIPEYSWEVRSLSEQFPPLPNGFLVLIAWAQLLLLD